jgi:hypothetical protein
MTCKGHPCYNMQRRAPYLARANEKTWGKSLISTHLYACEQEHPMRPRPPQPQRPSHPLRPPRLRRCSRRRRRLRRRRRRRRCRRRLRRRQGRGGGLGGLNVGFGCSWALAVARRSGGGVVAFGGRMHRRVVMRDAPSGPAGIPGPPRALPSARCCWRSWRRRGRSCSGRSPQRGVSGGCWRFRRRWPGFRKPGRGLSDRGRGWRMRRVQPALQPTGHFLHFKGKSDLGLSLSLPPCPHFSLTGRNANTPTPFPHRSHS